MEKYNELQGIVRSAAYLLGCNPSDVPGAICKLREKVKKLEKRLIQLGEPLVPTEGEPRIEKEVG